MMARRARRRRGREAGKKRASGSPASSYKLGVKFFGSGDLAKAETHLRAFLRWHEEGRVGGIRAMGASVEHARMLLGAILLGTKRLEEAAGVFRTVVNLNPTLAEGHNNLGVAYERQGLYWQARECFAQAVQLRAGFRQAAGNLARVGKRIEQGGNRVSLCMIVRDEEENLGPCLESFRSVADEIVVVDTGSADRTPDIARQYGAKVYHFPWCDDFSAARNESVKHATGDIIFWTDADDRIDPAEAVRLRELLRSAPPAGISIILSSVGAHDAENTAYQLRAFPNLPGVRFEGTIHEQVTFSLERLGLKTINADIKIIHSGYEDDEVLRRKIERNIPLLEKELAEKPESVFVKFNLAVAYNQSGENDRAAEMFQELVAVGDERKAKYWMYAYARFYLAIHYWERGRLAEARQTLEELVAYDPGFFWGRLELGAAYHREERYQDALEQFLAAEEIGFGTGTDYLPADMKFTEYSFRCRIGRCYEQLGEAEKAEAEFKRALEIPTYVHQAHLWYGNLLLARERYVEAAEQFRAWVESGEDEGLGHFKLAIAAMHLGDSDEAVRELETAQAAGYDTAELHCNRGSLFARRGEHEEAERAYLRGLELDPDSAGLAGNLCHLYWKTDALPKARDHIERLLSDSSSGPFAHLLGCLLALKEEAVEEFLARLAQLGETLPEEGKVVLETLEQCSEFFLDVSRRLRELGRRLEAVVALQIAVHLSPASAHLWKELGALHLNLGNWEEARSAVEQALLLDPHDVEAFTLLGDCYRLAGADQASAVSYRQARERLEHLADLEEAPAPGQHKPVQAAGSQPRHEGDTFPSV